MKLNLYQIILGIIAMHFLLKGFFKYAKRERKQTLFKLLATLLIWGGIFSFAIFPNFSHIVSQKIGLGENLNTLIFIGFIIIFVILFKLISIIENLEKNISEIVRKEALNKLNNDIALKK